MTVPNLIDTGPLKLAVLYELYGLPDCAAELLQDFVVRFGYPERLAGLLDALVPIQTQRKESYREFIRRFETDPVSFYPDR